MRQTAWAIAGFKTTPDFALLRPCGDNGASSKAMLAVNGVFAACHLSVHLSDHLPDRCVKGAGDWLYDMCRNLSSPPGKVNLSGAENRLPAPAGNAI